MTCLLPTAYRFPVARLRQCAREARHRARLGFTLRDGIKWSNGDPVKASDFVFSYRRIMNPETGAKYANILYPILNSEKANKGQGKVEDIGVKAIDDKTLEIKLEQPTPYFLELLTHQTSLPVHPGSVEKFGKDFALAVEDSR